MNKQAILPIVIASLLCFLLLVVADLVPFWMPMMGELVALVIVVVLLLGWAAFILFEATHDEREVVIQMRSGRIAYLCGIGFLGTALVVQSLMHAVDPWIAGALAVMVVAKLLTRLYLD